VTPDNWADRTVCAMNSLIPANQGLNLKLPGRVLIPRFGRYSSIPVPSCEGGFIKRLLIK